MCGTHGDGDAAGGCGLAGVWHHSRAHDFFACRRWDPDELGLALLDFLVTVFVKVGADPPRR